MAAWNPSLLDSDATAVAIYFARSIALLATVHNDRWGVTPFPDGTLRLNAGFCEALTAAGDEFLILLVENSRIRRLRRFGVTVQSTGEAFYRPVPGSVRIAIDLSRVTHLQPVLDICRPGHEAFLLKASDWALGAGVRKAHRNHAVAWIESVSKKKLARPPWASNSMNDLPAPEAEYWEGAERRSVQTTHERSGAARTQCIAHYGTECHACGFSFGERYGSIGMSYIEVHHLVPFTSGGPRKRVDPIKDLRPICSNCHRMLHTMSPPMHPDRLRERLRGGR